MSTRNQEIRWRARKRNCLGLPWTFTVYTLTDEMLLIESGFLNKKEDEVRLYRILDLTLNRSLGQRLFRMGTITVESRDTTMPKFEIKNIKDPVGVKDMLSDMVEEERDKKRVRNVEVLDSDTFEEDE